MADENQPKGANTSFPVFSAGDSAGKVLSAGYQNKLSGAIERLSQATFGKSADALVTGPMTFRKGKDTRQIPDGWIRVQNNYPFRLPKLSVVGIDHPVISQRVTDVGSLLRFIDNEVVYSCMAAQARHRNRIAILQQDLMPGDWGYAAYEGLSKAVFIQTIGPNAGAAEIGTISSTTTTSHAITSPYGESEERNLPWMNHESSGDHHRHLGIPGARFGVSGSAPGAEYDLDGVVWGARRRPKWLFPIVDGSRERSLISNPFENAQLMTSHGRVTAVVGYSVPEISSSGVSSFVCSGGAWVLASSSCGEGTSSQMFPEYAPYSTISGMSTRFALPCTEGATESAVPCLQDIPATDNDMYDIAGTAMDWSYALNVTPDSSLRTRWLIGQVALGNPVDNSQYTGPFDPTDEIGSSPNFDREHNYEPCFFPSDDTFPEIGTVEYIERIRQCCATITCTYQRDGSSLTRFSPSGAGLYRLAYMGTSAAPYSGPVDCVCPDSLVADRLGYEFANMAMPEITLGMIYSTTTTTTTTTSTTSSTTTTTTIGSCCKFGVNLDYIGCDDGLTLTQCTALQGGDVNSVEWSNGGTCDGTCAEAVCLPNLGTCDEYKVGGGFIGGLYEPQGAGTTCGTVTCPTTTTSTSTTTSTTSSTTTTTSPPSTTTTTSSTTTTTVEASSTTTTSSTTTSSAGGSSTTSSTTTTSATCSAFPNECTYQCQNVGGYQWVNTSATCSAPCACDTVPSEGSICGTCDIAHEGNVCSDDSFCI